MSECPHFGVTRVPVEKVFVCVDCGMVSPDDRPVWTDDEPRAERWLKMARVLRETDPPEVFECDNCGEDLELGVPHDCPVIGAPVQVDMAPAGLRDFSEEARY